MAVEVKCDRHHRRVLRAFEEIGPCPICERMKRSPGKEGIMFRSRKSGEGASRSV